MRALSHSSIDSPRVICEVATLAGAGQYAEACVVVNRALADAPRNPDLLFAKGSVLLDWGRFRQSRKVYEETERAGLRSAVLYLQLGWACFKSDDLDAAETNLRKAVAADPNAPKV